MRKILNFASFEAKKFSPSFRFEVKITESKRNEKFKAEKREKKRKKQISKKSKKKQKKQKNTLNFASLRFASKRKLLKRSKAKN
jgi:hypothetical protein